MAYFLQTRSIFPKPHGATVRRWSLFPSPRPNTVRPYVSHSACYCNNLSVNTGIGNTYLLTYLLTYKCTHSYRSLLPSKPTRHNNWILPSTEGSASVRLVSRRPAAEDRRCDKPRDNCHNTEAHRRPCKPDRTPCVRPPPSLEDRSLPNINHRQSSHLPSLYVCILSCILYFSPIYFIEFYVPLYQLGYP